MILCGCFPPFLLEGRQIIQLLCLSQLSWDDPIDVDIQQKWIKWKFSLKKFRKIKLNRCYKAKGFGKVVSCSFHYFSDPWESDYGQIKYLRLINAARNVYCRLVIAKSQVAPMKYRSIIRLDLAAAVLSTKMLGLVKIDLSLDR